MKSDSGHNLGGESHKTTRYGRVTWGEEGKHGRGQKVRGGEENKQKLHSL